MSRKSLTTESFTTKPSRNDRFAQMSRQEQIIEQKKREIQARLQQQKEKPKPPPSPATTTKSSSTTAETKKATKTLWKGNLGNKPNQNANNKSNAQFNIFSNDGSFLDQFKQMNDGSSSSSSSSSSKKGFDQNIANSSITPDNTRDSSERSYSDERNKPSRWSKSRNQPMPFPPDDTSLIPPKISRFSDPPPDIHQIVPSYAPNFTQSEIFTNNFTVQPPITAPVSVPPPNTNSVLTNYPVVTSAAPLLLPPPLTIPGIPPPQIVQANNVGALIAPPPPHTNISNQTMTGISVPPPILSVAPPPCVIELTSIPAPTPIPLHTIPQPEPINTLTIPPPAPLQLQNIPSPSPIRLNEIPNPKPIDLLNIPAPGDKPKLGKMTNPDFIKNVPPPNKSVPPPNMGTVNVTELPNITIPPPNTSQAIPPTSVPPPILTHHHHAGHHVQVTNAHVQTLIGAVSSASIPSLMAQPILPPPGMARTAVQPPSMQTVGVVSQSMVNLLPPPVTVTALPGPPPVLNQPPPLAQTNQIPPMNFPPPLGPPPTVLVNVNAPPPGIDTNAVCPPGSTSHDAMVSLGRMVAQCGSGIEDIVQQRSAQDPSLWFLFHKNSAAYQQYRQLVEQFRAEYGPNGQNQNQKQQEAITEYQPEDIYEPDCITDDELQGQDCNMSCADQNTDFDNLNESARKRKRKSRWGEKVIETTILVQSQPCLPNVSNLPMLSKVTRTDPGLIQYAINTFGSSNLSEEDWNKAEDHYKINLLYQEMVRKREEIEMLQRAGRNKYEYDSDEETDGGTWEHKLRMQEMEATQLWANELTRQAEGKHHIGDFLPPDELKKFMEKYSAAKEGRQPNLSDYKEFKLKEDNIGFKMLQKLGWQEGQGLGSEGTGIVDPVNKATSRDSNQGLGLQQSDGIGNTDDEYDAYRKRMMLAYRFRPNPLNNPRRPYY